MGRLCKYHNCKKHAYIHGRCMEHHEVYLRRKAASEAMIKCPCGNTAKTGGTYCSQCVELHDLDAIFDSIFGAQ